LAAWFVALFTLVAALFNVPLVVVPCADVVLFMVPFVPLFMAFMLSVSGVLKTLATAAPSAPIQAVLASWPLFSSVTAYA